MKYGFVHGVPALEMLYDYALQQLGGDSSVPDAFRIDDDNRPAFAHAEARRLASFDAIGSEKQTLALEQRCQQRVECTPPPVRGAVSARAHDDMARVRFHRAR